LAAHQTNNSGPILDDQQPFSSTILGPFMVVVTNVLLALLAHSILLSAMYFVH
jgi:hypothetical protein